MKTILLLGIAGSILLIGAGCQKDPVQEDFLQPPFAQQNTNQVFCSPEGELTRTQSIQSHRSYCLQTQKQEPELNTPIDYSFAIIDDQGERLKNLDVVHEKIMHVIVVRRDLTQFQHVHPEFDAETRTFTLKNLVFTSEGPYTLYFDFKPHEAQAGVTLTEDMAVGDSSKNRTPDLRNTNTVQTVDKFKVTLNHENKKILSGTETKLKFQVEGKNNEPIEHVSKYLGELGHLVIIHSENYEYIHAHPPVKSLTNRYNQIPFLVTFPEAGKYKMFLEFKYGKNVYEVDYAVDVAPGVVDPQDDSMTH